MDRSPESRRPLRLWPGVLLAGLLLLIRLVVPAAAPGIGAFGTIGAAFAALAIVAWWVGFSRARWLDRLGAVIVMAGALAVLARLSHGSIAGAGLGALLYIWAIPLQALALVVAAMMSRHIPLTRQRVSMVTAILVASLPFLLVRTAGVTSDIIGSELHWRWTPTPEERLLAAGTREPLAAPPAASRSSTGVARTKVATEELTERPAATAAPAASAPAVASQAEWPGFRGRERDSIIRGVRLATDWATSPPVALWRHPIGPGWSSFAVHGDRLYTQEQRGDEESVSAYSMSTGEPVWRHRDATRFWESNGGAGPRATPALDQGRVYSFGATGILNALAADSGGVVWSRNVAADTGMAVPTWGFASSPLVTQGLVVVAASGTLAAYDLVTGAPRWTGPRHDSSYSSPQLATIGGVPQILLLSGAGVTSVAPADGALLWEHAGPGPGGAIVQPALTTDGDVLINAIAMTGGAGLRRLAIAQTAAGWSAQERWTSSGLKPYFNDFVVHHGHAFGFDGNILACVDLADGQRRWKGGRYGNGQLVLLPEDDLLLVLSEEGELALVSATPDRFRELARWPVLDGKTWNHPVLIGDVLLVRNDREMAAYRLARATGNRERP